MRAFDFTGRSVLVTGASHGIGRAVAAAFAQAGADLAILSSTPDILEAGAAIGRETSRPVRAEVCDITDREAVRRVVGGLGPLDVLVNNAGLELVTPMLGGGDEVERTFVRIIDINVVGPTTSPARRCPRCRPAAASCSPRRSGERRLAPTSRPTSPRSTPISASCGCWRRSWGPAASGSTPSALAGSDPRGTRSLGEVSAAAGIGEDEMLDQILAGQALPGLMEPSDVTDLYLFLASDLARNITGQAVNVDCGEVMA